MKKPSFLNLIFILIFISLADVSYASGTCAGEGIACVASSGTTTQCCDGLICDVSQNSLPYSCAQAESTCSRNEECCSNVCYVAQRIPASNNNPERVVRKCANQNMCRRCTTAGNRINYALDANPCCPGLTNIDGVCTNLPSSIPASSITEIDPSRFELSINSTCDIVMSSELQTQYKTALAYMLASEWLLTTFTESKDPRSESSRLHNATQEYADYHRFRYQTDYFGWNYELKLAAEKLRLARSRVDSELLSYMREIVGMNNALSQATSTPSFAMGQASNTSTTSTTSECANLTQNLLNENPNAANASSKQNYAKLAEFYCHIKNRSDDLVAPYETFSQDLTGVRGSNNTRSGGLKKRMSSFDWRNVHGLDHNLCYFGLAGLTNYRGDDICVKSCFYLPNSVVVDPILPDSVKEELLSAVGGSIGRNIYSENESDKVAYPSIRKFDLMPQWEFSGSRWLAGGDAEWIRRYDNPFMVNVRTKLTDAKLITIFKNHFKQYARNNSISIPEDTSSPTDFIDLVAQEAYSIFKSYGNVPHIGNIGITGDGFQDAVKFLNSPGNLCRYPQASRLAELEKMSYYARLLSIFYSEFKKVFEQKHTCFIDRVSRVTDGQSIIQGTPGSNGANNLAGVPNGQNAEFGQSTNYNSDAPDSAGEFCPGGNCDIGTTTLNRNGSINSNSNNQNNLGQGRTGNENYSGRRALADDMKKLRDEFNKHFAGSDAGKKLLDFLAGLDAFKKIDPAKVKLDDAFPGGSSSNLGPLSAFENSQGNQAGSNNLNTSSSSQNNPRTQTTQATPPPATGLGDYSSLANFNDRNRNTAGGGRGQGSEMSDEEKNFLLNEIDKGKYRDDEEDTLFERVRKAYIRNAFKRLFRRLDQKKN